MPANGRALYSRKTQGDGKCNREQTADGPRKGDQVRVKRWGKSPPQDWRQDWHGKPHPEQDQIGRHQAWPALPPGRLLEPCSNAGPRGMAARGESPYKTRLIGQLPPFSDTSAAHSRVSPFFPIFRAESFHSVYKVETFCTNQPQNSS